MKRRMLLGLAALVCATGAHARVDYAIDLTQPEHHTGLVSIRFPATPGPYLDVRMPAWRTGRYNILNLANGVRGFSATDAAGRPLRWQKIDKSTWRIRNDARAPVTVRYELYGNELGLRSRHIDDSHAYLDASAVFLYADPLRADDVTVSLRVPTGWKSVSGMESPHAHQFVAPNWDVLVDSPIETGANKLFRFTEGGRAYDVVIWGEGNYDAPRLVADLRRTVAAASSIWSRYPFRRYVFMIHATDGVGGATEHLNSTVIQMPRTRFARRSDYLAFLSTASHEFIHTWNVKAYRGAGLVPYDYQSENYSTLLWVAEGSTSYFADQLLLRAGITRPEEYFEYLSSVVDGHRRRPGATVQSVAEASFDEWIAPSGDRATNASVNIYDQGEIVSWMLDLALLQQTGKRVSYRDVHEALFQRFPASAGRGFSEADVLAILRSLTGQSWDAWWARHVHAPLGAVDFAALLRPVGLSLAFEHAAAPKAWAGWTATAGADGARLAAVEKGSPAWNAGFTAGDLIVAIDGDSVDGGALAFDGRRPGQTVQVRYVRRGETREKRLVLGGDVGAAVVTAMAAPSAAQRALYQRWLLVPHPASRPGRASAAVD